MNATTRNSSSPSPLIATLKARKAARRKREIALLAIALGFVAGAFIFHEPFLILISVFPALASVGQR